MEVAIANAIASALSSELIKGGLGWLLAAFLFWRMTAERAERLKCDAEFRALLLEREDKSHTRVMEANTRQDATFSKVGDALVALTAEVKALTSKGAAR